MATTFRSFLLLLATLGATAAQAQTPTLEFAPGAGNTTANGPSAASQVITFQNNTTNPTNNTMTAYSPAVTTTFALSNQQYTLPTSRIASGAGVAFGAGLSTTSGTAPAFALFPLLNAVGGSSNGNYTSASGVTGGIDVAANSGTEVFTSVEPLPSTMPANTARYQYADLTLTFNRAVVNPVVHLTGLGGSFTTANGVKTGYTTELDLLTKGPTMSRLSGSNELTVNSTQILNNAAAPDGGTGSGAASGSVLVNTSNQGVTTLVFRLYLRPAAAGGTIHGDNASTHLGDGWIISVSTLTGTTATSTQATIAPLPVKLVDFTAQAAPGGRGAQLAWTTASEVNNDYFEVERSLDGATYAPLGRVAGQGMKTTTTAYTFVDQPGLGTQSAGLVYYRLRQVDLDGTATYSPVRAVRLGAAAAQASLYPNPAQASTTLDLSALPAAASYQVQVLDATGRQVQRLLLAGGEAQRLDLNPLAPGLLTVLVTGTQADGTLYRQALRLHKE